MPDLNLLCVDCKSEFIFGEGEQDYFREKFGEGYKAPKRCKACRAVRRATKSQKPDGR